VTGGGGGDLNARALARPARRGVRLVVAVPGHPARERCGLHAHAGALAPSCMSHAAKVVGGTSGYWHCRVWNDVPAGCPVPRARLGTPCDHDGLTCDYAQCCAGPAIGYRMRCTDGYWQSYVDTGCACAEPTCP
jgi:hypothetical protein